MRGGGDEVCVRDGGWVFAGGDESGDVCHIGKEIGADEVSDLAHLIEVNGSGVGRGSDGDHFGFEFLSDFGEFIVMDGFVLFIDAIVEDFIEAS